MVSALDVVAPNAISNKGVIEAASPQGYLEHSHERLEVIVCEERNAADQYVCIICSCEAVGIKAYWVNPSPPSTPHPPQ